MATTHRSYDRTAATTHRSYNKTAATNNSHFGSPPRFSLVGDGLDATKDSSQNDRRKLRRFSSPITGPAQLESAYAVQRRFSLATGKETRCVHRRSCKRQKRRVLYLFGIRACVIEQAHSHTGCENHKSILNLF